ncbi:MAG: hypothetical protein ACLRPT_03550 [Akkermansia muciniphila]
MKYLIVLPLIALFLVSCKNYEGHRYGNINASQKTIVVPTGAEDPIRELRTNYVKTDGNYGYPGAGVPTSVRTGNRVETFLDKRNARYGLEIFWEHREFDLLTMSHVFDYDASVIDLETREEITYGKGRLISIRIQPSISSRHG